MRRREFLAAAGVAGGAAAAGGAGTASAQEDGEEGGDGGGGGGAQHTVDMTDSLEFDPSSLTVAPGDTVVWETVGSQPHSVTAYDDGIPEEAEYFASGDFEDESAARDGWPEGSVEEGETYEHTFETEGTFEYFCIPHEGAGMVATVEVAEGGGGGGGGAGGGEMEPEEMGVPFQPHFVGIATILGIIVSLVFTFYVLKYGESPHASDPNRK